MNSFAARFTNKSPLALYLAAISKPWEGRFQLESNMNHESSDEIVGKKFLFHDYCVQQPLPGGVCNKAAMKKLPKV